MLKYIEFARGYVGAASPPRGSARPGHDRIAPATTRLHRALRVLATALLATLAPAAAFGAPAPASDPAAIVAAADHVRFPPDAFQVEVKVTNMIPGKTEDLRHYQILSKGNANTVVRTLAPAAERGQIMLMRGRELWVFLPSVAQPVRMPLSQKLTGQVANGDLARANFTGDYTPKILRTDRIEGRDYAVLELAAVNRSVTYQKVVYWVDAKSMWPYKAEFYTLSGRLMKTCLYRDFKKMEGAVRPSRLIMQDALKQGEISHMVYSGMKRRELADKIFTKDYLKKLQQ